MDISIHWKRKLAILCFMCGKTLSEIFSTPNWEDTILMDTDLAEYWWNEIYLPSMRNR